MHLRLDLDLEAEPISGSVGLHDAEPHEFTGYASLIATLQSIRAEHADERSVLPRDSVR